MSFEAWRASIAHCPRLPLRLECSALSEGEGSLTKVRSTNARAASILAVALGFAGQAAAQEQPKALDCTFEAGTSVAYAGGDYKATVANRLTFRIDAIDLEGQRAELQTEKGGKGE